MLTRTRELLVASITRVWLSTASGSWRRLPRPADEPHVHAAGDHPHRVLVLGNGISMSYGVLSHQIGFGGHLARQLTERTNRGSDVQLIVDVELDPKAVLAIINDVRPARFDAIVLTLGGAESVRLMPVLAWRADLDTLLDQLVAETSSTEIALVEIPEISRVVSLPGFARGLVLRRITEMTAQAREAAAAHERTTFLPFKPTGTDLVRSRDRTTYEEWGALVAVGIAERLTASADRARAIESVDDQERVFALGELGILDTSDEARFEQIIDTAQALFGVAGATINFIDEQRQWVSVLSGGARQDAPRADAFCDVTIQRPGLFVVNDALAHPRFKDLPAVIEGQVRFFAGYPIETPSGIRVGALCLMDPVPRGFARADEALLRELALRVQAVFGHGAVA